MNRVVDSLLQHGRVTRPYLGVGMLPRVPLPERLREKFNLPQTSGLMLLSVEADAPADKAGLTIGDILLTLGGTAVPDTDDVQALLGGKEVGAVVRAGILRGGQRVLAPVVGDRGQTQQLPPTPKPFNVGAGDGR